MWEGYATEQNPWPQIFRYVTKDKVLDIGDLLDPDPKRSKVRFILLQFGQDFKATTRALHYADADDLEVSLNTKNGLESILAMVEQRVGKVDRWTTSDRKQRRLPTTLLEIEPRLSRLRGYRALPQLRVALKQGVTQGQEVMVA
jgi:hypothetical protein